MFLKKYKYLPHVCNEPDRMISVHDRDAGGKTISYCIFQSQKYLTYIGMKSVD